MAFETLDPIVQQYLDGLARSAPLPLRVQSVAAARREFVESQQLAVPRLPGVDIHDFDIEGPIGSRLLLRIVRPPDQPAALPAMIFLHGGGWLTGDRDTHDRLVRDLAVATSSAVVFVEYTRTPEASFPVALEEAFAATRYVIEHRVALGIAGDGLLVAGDSAGGNLAAALCLLAKRRGGPLISGQVLLYPTTDGLAETESRHRFGRGYFLTTEDLEFSWDLYAPAAPDRHVALVSPLRATLLDLSQLPPALVVTAECDPLRDEGEAYARRLIHAGVPVVAIRQLATIHAFMTLNALADSPSTRSAISAVGAFAREIRDRRPHPPADRRTTRVEVGTTR